MGLKVSCFTTITNPILRQDPFMEAIKSYLAVFDEVVVVDGGSTDGSLEMLQALDDKRLVILSEPWEEDWSFDRFTQNKNEGLYACTGDWAVLMDIDFLIKKEDGDNLRQALEQFPEAHVVNLLKWQFLLVDRYNIKSRLPYCLNKRFPQVRLGEAIDARTDLVQPIWMEGEKEVATGKIPYGKLIQKEYMPDPSIPIFNYECCFKDEETVKREFFKNARAWKHYYQTNEWGGQSEEAAWQFWKDMQGGRIKRPSRVITIDEHPEPIQETIKLLTSDKFGYSGFNMAQVASYYS